MRKLMTTTFITPNDVIPDAVQALGKSAKIKMIGYWGVTTFLLFNVLAGAIAELVQRQDNVEGMIVLFW